MRALIVTASLCLLATAANGAPQQHSFVWADQPATKTVVTHKRHRHHHAVATRPAVTISRLETEMAALKRELDDFRNKAGAPPPWVPISIRFFGHSELAIAGVRLAGLPDLHGIPGHAPASPVPPVETPGRDAVADERRAVAEAREYLIRTATPGGTMNRQGADLAIGRLHPAMAVRLAAAVRLARAGGLARAGVFSAYRPPAFGVGAFHDKFESLHSYGLAVDMTGIGGARSGAAHLWASIVRTVGLFLPYGPNNRSEFNHTQMVPDRIARSGLRPTIVAAGPKDLRRMWLASGVADHVADDQPASASAKLLPPVDWGAGR